MTDHEVAIVGAGPVGLLLACLLAQERVAVVVYEKRAGPPTGSRAIGILPPGVRALRAAGVEDAVRAEALCLSEGVAWSRGRMLASLRLDDADAPVLTLPQWRIEELLRARLSALDPRALRTGTVISGLRESDAGIVMRRTSGEETAECSARIVVAADGVRSGIRSALDLGWRQCRGTAHYVMTDAGEVTDLGARAHLFCAASGIVESFPLPDHRRRWVARVGTPDTADPETLAAIIRERTGIALTAAPQDSASAFTARQHRAARFARGRVVLLGDAAHELSPIGGQGMNLGWIGALRLAPEIRRALRDDRADFRRYERRQQRSAGRARRRARFNMAMGRPVRGPVRGLRDLAARVLGTRPLRGIALRAFTMRGL